jgi:phage gpG-like protein
MSVTFSVKSHVKELTAETERRVGVALNNVAIDWHAASVRAISEMVYRPGDLRVDGKDTRAYKLTNRLRSSITFTSPSTHATHTFTHDLGTESYTPPKPDRLEAMVGTNVEYAPAVHDGLGGGSVTVKAHTRRITQAFGRAINPRTVNVSSHSKMMPARKAKPFIEQPGIGIAKKAPQMILAELNR